MSQQFQRSKVTGEETPFLPQNELEPIIGNWWRKFPSSHIERE